VNLKIVFNYNRDSSNCLVYYIESQYPTPDQYKNGVKGVLFHAERKNPGSKVVNHNLRSDIFHRLIVENGYEALLVDRKNRITEGSRSNIFFIANNTLFTCSDNLILNGITRKHLLEICRVMEIRVLFECVKADEISNYESVVMTGTSPVILPFCTINNINFNVKHPLISLLRTQIMKSAEESRTEFAKLD
jgi:branched-chain amino acid aminotransferase